MSEDSLWYKRRPYLHFDLPLSLQDATSYVSDPDSVASHAFYPFLTYKLLTPRITKTPNGAKPFVKDPKSRRISYPTHKDGYVFSYYKFKLEAVYEKWLKANGLGAAVTAFRSTCQNNVTLAKQAFDFIKDNPGCEIVATDVESFFDTINHEELKRIWARFLGVARLPDDHHAVYKAITRYSVVEKYRVYNLFGIPLSARPDRDGDPKRLCTPKQFREKVIRRGLVERNPDYAQGIGIPQGSSLSPLLSNMYMADLDLAMLTWIASIGGAYWRYCDDILIVVPCGQPVAALSRLDQELQGLRLQRSSPKTQMIASNQLASHKQLQYLGLIFNGSETLIRSSSIHRYHRKLKKAIQATMIRQCKETHDPSQVAPFRQQALYNMYSELPKRGAKIKEQQRRQKYRGNFTHYMDKSAKLLDSSGIRRQRLKLLSKFRSSIRKHV